MAKMAGKLSEVKYLKGAYRAVPTPWKPEPAYDGYNYRRSQPFEAARVAQRVLTKAVRREGKEACREID